VSTHSRRGAWHGRRRDQTAGLARPVRHRKTDPAGFRGVLLSVRLATPVENLLTTVVLAFSMSADAFAAALGKGAALTRPRLSLSEALRTGVVFGTIESITPVMGWAAGLSASSYITAIDHWIAFALLLAIGTKMIWESARGPDARCKPDRHSLKILVATAIGTSIDAMAVGVTLAFIDGDIVVTALAIGCATLLMATVGILIGRFIGEKFGRIAEAIGGVGLIAIGAKILIEHMLS
jgi:putative Mn2+ efflux pump MntP